MQPTTTMDAEGGGASRRLVEGSLPCVRCGYELKGLPVEGQCPECSLAVGSSLRGDLLVFSSPSYLRRLKRGAMVVELCIPVMVAAVVAMWVLVELTPRVARNEGAILWLVITGVAVTALLGWWWLSEPDPARSEREGRQRARRVVRWVLVVELGAMLMAAAVWSVLLGELPRPMLLMLFDTPARMRRFAEASYWGLAATAILALPVRHFASMVYLRGLARRMPDQALEQRVRFVLWFATGTIALGLLWLGARRLIPEFGGLLFGVLIGVMWWTGLYALTIRQARKHLSAIERAATAGGKDG